jgi:2-dehydropantoate 2-reductase
VDVEHKLAGYDFIWLTVKCTAVESNLELLKAFTDANTTIICCQNGLGSEKLVAAAFPNNKVLRAIIGFNVVEEKAGHLHRSTLGELVFEADKKITTIAQQLESELLPLHISDGIEAEQWAKLQLNLTNALNALSDIPLKQMLENRDYRKIMASLMDELLSVTKVLGLKLPRLTALPAHWFPTLLRLPNSLFQILAKQMLAIDPGARLSMWWDLSRGKQTEIEFLNGALVKQAALLGIDCPMNNKLVEIIHQVELGEKKIGVSTEFLRKQFDR